MFYAGIDWEDKGYVVRIFDDDGEIFKKHLYYEKKQNDFIRFSKTLDKLSKNKSEILIGIETKHNPIVNFLLKKGYKTYVINPNMMESLRMRHSQSGKKSDDFDALVIADSLRTDLRNHELVKEQDSKLKQLDLVFRQYSSVKGEMHRISEQLIALLKDFYPAYLELFNNKFCKTGLDLLINYPDFESLEALSKVEIKAFLWSKRCYQNKKVEEIYEIAHSTNRIDSDKDIIEIRKSIAKKLAMKMKALNDEVEEYENLLEKLSEDDKDVQLFQTLPGAGPIISVGLLSVFGRDRSNYQNAEEVCSIAGVVPVTIQSGSYKHDQFRFACNKMYRNILTQFAFSSLSQSKWALTYYKRKRNEGKKHRHALRCLARLWMKVAFSMWKKEKPYNENEHLVSIVKHNFNNELAGKSGK
jgi:transposase